MEKKDKKNIISRIIAFALISATIGRGGYEAYKYFNEESDENSDKAKTEEMTKDTTAEIVKTVDEIEGNDTLPKNRDNTRAYTETGKQNVGQTVVNENTDDELNWDDANWEGSSNDAITKSANDLAETQEEENNLDNNINKNNTTIAKKRENLEERKKVLEKLQGEKED